MLKHNYLGTPISVPPSNPHWPAWTGRLWNPACKVQISHARPPVPSSMDVCDLGCGSGPPRLHTGIFESRRTTTQGRATEDCNIHCKNITKRWTRARTGRRTKRKQHEMGRDRYRSSPKKRRKFHIYPKWPPAVPLWGQQWTIRCRLPRKHEIERQHNKSILWEFQSSIISPMHNRYNNNNNGRNGSFLRGWLPHRGKAQMACNYCFPTRTMFSINSEFWRKGMFGWENLTSHLVRTKNSSYYIAPVGDWTHDLPTKDRSSICANDISLRWRDRQRLQRLWWDPGKANTLHNCNVGL